MAEAAVVLGLISSTGTLIDFGTKLVERINEFEEGCKDRPKTFDNIRSRLPLTIDSLERIKSQAEKGSLSDKTAEAVKTVVDECLAQIKTLNALIDKILPSKDASGWERRWLALKSLTKDKDVQKSVGNLEAQIQNLILYQSTSSADYALRILELQSLRLDDENENFDHGLCLGNAPRLYDGAFVGRSVELDQLKEWLTPNDHRQSVVAVSGFGGIGKTQLSIEFAQRSRSIFSSVFWLNAKTEGSLQEDMASLYSRIAVSTAKSSNATEANEAVSHLRKWLSEKNNWRWLIIFDNYDNPSFPGLQSEDGYDIRKFFPFSSQGSILITSRTKKLTFAKPLELKKLEDIAESLAILKERSGREVEGDQNAERLVLRLDGLPLALVTAGTYIRQSSDSLDDYLNAYEGSWQELEENTDEIFDYDHTLYSTWNLSFKQIEKDQGAANLLRLLAYFDNKDIWFELFQIEDGPCWFQEIASDKKRFRKCMKKLNDYSMVDVREGYYSLHTCVHDWTWKILNRGPEAIMYDLAVQCITKHVQLPETREYWITNNRLLQHAVYASSNRFQNLFARLDLKPILDFALLYQIQGKTREAEQLYQKALTELKKTLGPDHPFTLGTLNNLGSLLEEDGKTLEAEQMFQRALAGFEKAFGPNHPQTLNVTNNLATLYKDQEKVHEAEQMYQRALAGFEKAFGPNHPRTLDVTNNLALLYKGREKIQEAEQMYQRSLAGYEKAFGLKHPRTLGTTYNLANLYSDQGKMQEAEQMYQRALAGYEKTFGPTHTETLAAIARLGLLSIDQCKMHQAEKFLQRFAKGCETNFGAEDLRTREASKILQIMRENRQLQ